MRKGDRAEGRCHMRRRLSAFSGFRYPDICCLFSGHSSCGPGCGSGWMIQEPSRRPGAVSVRRSYGKSSRSSVCEAAWTVQSRCDRLTIWQTVPLKQWRIRTSESSRKSSSYRSGIPSVQRRRHHPDPVSRRPEVSGIRYAFIIAVSERIII